MNKCIKFLSALNVISLANQIVGNNLINTGGSTNAISFEQLFKWKSFAYGFQEASAVNKPIFLLIYKAQCPSCQKLKQKFFKSVRLMDLSDRCVTNRNVHWYYYIWLRSIKIINIYIYTTSWRYNSAILFFIQLTQTVFRLPLIFL